MKIAIDFDDTITLNPEAWFDAICLFRNTMKADVRIVTFRCEGLPGKTNPDIDKFLSIFTVPLQVIYTGGYQKAHTCAELGWNPDVWIDDNPATIASYADMVGMVKGCEVNNDTGGVKVEVKRTTPKPCENPLADMPPILIGKEKVIDIKPKQPEWPWWDKNNKVHDAPWNTQRVTSGGAVNPLSSHWMEHAPK